MTMMPTVRTVASGAVLALVLAGCGGGSKDDDNASDDPTAASESAGPAASAASDSVPTFEFGVDDKAKGPAPEIEGAVAGGTIKVLDLDDVAHLDPARIYVNTYQNISQLMTRTLTGYRQYEGKVTLVGDLATDTGTTTDGGKTWKFTLRDGITYEDGSKIVADDVKYGLERGFVKDYSEGPTYIQEWLANSTDFRKVYQGPYDGKRFDAISAPDDKTLILKFEKPHADLPFAAALPLAAAVKKSEDTKGKYDLDPFASGPYKISEHKVDKSITLVKNDKWKPESDPIRYQLVDGYDFEFGDQPLQQNQRIVAARGDDARAVPAAANISPEVIEQVEGDPELKARTINGYTPFVRQYNINNKRITDLEVRKALLFAFPKFQARAVSGGAINGELATTISSPTLVGHQSYDLFDVNPNGDPTRAKETLEKAGKLGQKIVYAYGKSDRGEKVAVVVADGLTKAGFEVVKKPLDLKTYYDEVGKLDNPYDLFAGGWGADWPSGSTVYPVTLDGRRVANQSPNYTQFGDKTLEKEMDRVSEITDPIEAGKAWAALDKKIMEQVPYIPYLYDKANHIYGPKVGGVYLDGILGVISLNGLFVKP